MYPSSARRARHSFTWLLSAALAVGAGVLCAQLTAHPKHAPLAGSASHTSSQVAIASSGASSANKASSSATTPRAAVDTASFTTTPAEANETLERGS